MTGQYFGQRWDAPAFDYATEVAVPVGQHCGYCGELVEEGDSGAMEIFVDAKEHTTVKPAHIECFLRQAMGSPAHLRGECSCHGKPDVPDERSWREQGREVVRIITTEHTFHL